MAPSSPGRGDRTQDVAFGSLTSIGAKSGSAGRRISTRKPSSSGDRSVQVNFSVPSFCGVAWKVAGAEPGDGVRRA